MRLPLLLLVTTLAACGGDDAPDILGMYETTEQLVNGQGCSGGETPDPGVPYFRIVEEELLGFTYYTRENCESTDEATCAGGGGLLAEETSDGYQGNVSFSSGDTSNCTLGWITYTAELDGDVLTFETYNYSESGPADPCDTSTAEDRGEDMPCVSYELIAGVRQ
jgi:hypothetical protein